MENVMSLPPPSIALRHPGSQFRAAFTALVASFALGLAAQAEEFSIEEATRGLEEHEAARPSDGHLLRVRNLTRNLFRGEASGRSVESIAEHEQTEQQAEKRQQGELVRIVHGDEALTCKNVQVEEKSVIETGHLFEAREWHFDGFFVYADDADTGGAGGGAALTYYPWRWFGFGAEAIAFSDLSTDGSASALAFLRLPLDQIGLSFHLVAGIGTAFDSGEFSAQFQAGAGLEARLLYEWGVFLDFRLVEAPGENSSCNVRLGARRVF
jgi:hypothetical protein